MVLHAFNPSTRKAKANESLKSHLLSKQTRVCWWIWEEIGEGVEYDQKIMYELLKE